VASTVQKTQKSIVNFKSISKVLLETLSGCPILPIFDVHKTLRISGFYKLNVDTASPTGVGGGGKRKNKGVVVAGKSFR